MPERPEKIADTQYQDYLVLRVSTTAKGWILHLDPGWSVAIPRGPVIPKEGSMARVYGLGMGFRVRGVDIDGVEVYYRSEEQEERRHREAIDGYNARRSEA